MSLPYLNKLNGASEVEDKYSQKCLDEFEGELTAVQMGIAYGGCSESLGKLWKGRGKVYGFDTFEDLHPKELGEKGTFESDCMDYWYQKDILGTEHLKYKYIREELDKEGLDNVILRKGLIGKDSLKGISSVNYALLDMDMYESMKIGYDLVKDKIVKGGYLLLHDVLPVHHLPKLYVLYVNTILDDKDIEWEVVEEKPQSFIVALKKK